jgi:uncharacterized protein (DUF1800 family)
LKWQEAAFAARGACKIGFAALSLGQRSDAMISDATLIATRFGYGLPAPEGAAGSKAEMLTLLAGPDLMAERWPIAGVEAATREMLARKAAGRIEGTPEEIAASKMAAANSFGALVRRAQQRSFARAVDGVDGFRERLVSFWANHFTVIAKTATDNLLPFAMVEDAIRPHVAGSFADLLTAATLHPAMLLYLDQAVSVGPESRFGQRRGKGLNENLARELMELHTLGVDASYSQADVTQLAELLTGLTYSKERGMAFLPERAEPGAETVLGKTYGGKGLAPIKAVLQDLALRDETARHIARKLAVHFVSDTPEQGLVDSIAEVYRATGGNLMACYDAMLTHPSAWEPRLQKARQPFDFLTASARALGVSGAQIDQMEQKLFARSFPGAMAQMGQPFKKPLGPNGFPEAAIDWISPMGLAQRISWALQRPKMLLRDLPAPLAFAQGALAEWASPVLLTAVSRAEDQVQGVALVLASPEFNRR